MNPTPRLPEAELEVLAQLQQHGEATAQDVRRALVKQRPMSAASILTLLGRLEAKALVARRKGPIGKAFLFRATGAGGNALRQRLHKMAQRVFGTDRIGLVASLLESMPPDEKDLERLQKLLDGLRAERARSKRDGRRL